MGLVFQVFDADRIARLPGQLAVGHVRYSTMGSVRLENAQPLVVPSPWGPLALAHNGNLINAPQLRAELEAGGVKYAVNNDSVVNDHLIVCWQATVYTAATLCTTMTEQLTSP